MDKLKMTFSIIAKEVKKKRGTGEVPVFLGPRGMLALMYDRIAQFMKLCDEDESKYVLDLAVMAVFAFSTVLPDVEFEDEEVGERDEGPVSEELEGTGERDARESLISPDNEEVSNDPRWSPVRPGDPISRASEVEEVDE